MTEQPQVIEPYRPFPSFEEWSASTTVSPIVDRFVMQFTEMRTAEPDSATALRERATRWAAVDTGAIEGLYDVDRGFTITVAASTAILEAIQAEKGEAVERAVADALGAYEFVLDLATRNERLSEVALRELHQIVCASQATYRVLTSAGWQDQDLPKGVYKTHENRPLNLSSGVVHGYASVVDTSPEMARFIDELRNPLFETAHPVQQAAYAHYAFVAVHPFADGNGRVARAIASIFLYRDPGLPLVVFSDEKAGYISSLEAADAGRPQALVTFLGDRLVDTVNLLRGPQGSDVPPVIEQIADLTRELSGRGGYPHADVDSAALMLLESIRRHLGTAIERAGITSPLSAQLTEYGGSGIGIPEGFRLIASRLPVVLHTASAAPATASESTSVVVVVAKGLDGDVDFTLLTSRGDRLDVLLREVLPRITHTLELRLADFADSVLRGTIAAVAAQARATLQQNGYS